jgi:FAD/FMN-containing dehydrogenase
MTATTQKTLSGWGNYPQVVCNVARPERRRELESIVDKTRCIPRGLGRSYGDSAIAADGTVIDFTRMDRCLDFDETTGVLRCEAGTSLATILRDFGPRGFMPMVTPGTKFVTVGGCIANDVHGKGHHVDGCFSSCTESFRILLASGEIVEASRTKNPELFWANFGGMGLLGIILDATIRLRRVETLWFQQTAVSIDSLDEMLDALDEYHHLPYSVAWVDSLATGRSLGRGVLTVGSHAKYDDLSPRQQKKPLAISPASKLELPFELPSQALNVATIRMLNIVLDQVQRHGAAIAHYEKFFYPLDFIGEWNRGYGARGFTQYQFVVPAKDGRENIRELLLAIATSGQSPFLNVLKRFGPEHPNTMLSFPMEGYTFAVDFPIRPGLKELLHRLDQRVTAMGGRVYLGKDAFMTRATFEAMYPKLHDWKVIKSTWDPTNHFTSAQAQRLGLA